jgi:hypothetical protein
VAQTREQRIPEDVMGVPEGWDLDGQPFVVPADNRDSLDEAFEAAKYILRFIGGVTWFVPVRQEIKEGSGVYHTVEYAFFWSSYAPPKRSDDAVEEKVAAVEPEPAVVGG